MNTDTILDDAPDLRRPLSPVDQARVDALRQKQERALYRLHRLRYVLVLLAALQMALFYRHFSMLTGVSASLMTGVILLLGGAVFFGLRFPVSAFGGALLLQWVLLGINAWVLPLPVIGDWTLNALITGFLVLGIYHGMEVRWTRRLMS